MKHNKPEAPKGYRMLVNEVDTNESTDYAWMMAPDDWEYEWIPCIGTWFENKRVPWGNGKKYIEPNEKTNEFGAYRCRKL